MPLSTHNMVYDSPRTARDPQDIDFKQIKQLRIPWFRSQPNPTSHCTRGEEAISIACHPSPKSDIQEKEEQIKDSGDQHSCADRNDSENQNNKTQMAQQCPSNADVYRFQPLNPCKMKMSIPPQEKEPQNTQE